MSTSAFSKFGALAIFTVFGAPAVFGTACSSNDNNHPTIPIVGTGGKDGGGSGGATGSSGGSAGGSAGNGTGATAGGGTAGIGGNASGGSSGSRGKDGGPGDAAPCTPTTGPNGCYRCPATTDVEFLNHCTSSQCAAYDNVKNLPLYNNGNLPAVP